MPKLQIIMLSTLLIVLGGTMAFAGESDNFDKVVCDHFKVSTEKLEEVRWAGIPDDEVPVVFLVSQHSGLDPLTVAEMRARGPPWARWPRGVC